MDALVPQAIPLERESCAGYYHLPAPSLRWQEAGYTTPRQARRAGTAIIFTPLLCGATSRILFHSFTLT